MSFSVSRSDWKITKYKDCKEPEELAPQLEEIKTYAYA